MEDFEKVRILDSAVPKWPVWIFCAVATLLTGITAIPVGYGRMCFGMMIGYQIAQMIAAHKAHRIRKTLS